MQSVMRTVMLRDSRTWGLGFWCLGTWEIGVVLSVLQI